MEIIVDGEVLDLQSDFSIEIEDTNPIYNDRGSQSIPATVPATRRNSLLLGFPQRIDAGSDPNLPERSVEVRDGGYIRSGKLNVTDAGRDEGITFNIGFDNSTVYAKWQVKKLGELSGLPIYLPSRMQDVATVELLLDDMYRIYRFPEPQTDDFAIFPVAVNNESTGSDSAKQVYWEILNVAGSTGIRQPKTVKRLIDGTVTEVNVPDGYMVTPFLRVWRVLELIFSDIGVSVPCNPFKDDLELSRLVVLNNAADACCRGEIRYADLMPDCTVEEFMNALWVRFGLIYNINFNTGSVSLELIKDILDKQPSMTVDSKLSGAPKIIYGERQYVKLSAQTSIDGAAPSHERFEDFAKGVDMSHVRLGIHVSLWQNTGRPDAPKWDGDIYYEYLYPDPDDPDYPDPPDPWEDDYDDGDFDLYAYQTASFLPSVQSEDSPTVDSAPSFTAREFITGTWYRLDATNGSIRASSSSFFNWDPQPEGLNALELSSDDEFVPVAWVSNVGTGAGPSHNDWCPCYLFGARHYHSYIKGSDGSESDGDSTPLAFMFAYTRYHKTIGRLTPEDDTGQRMTLDDGTIPSLSLLFQFKDGLFNRFWSKYDEILRHGNRSVEAQVNFSRSELFSLNTINVVRLGNIRCLIDTVNYSIPSGKNVSVEMKLRTIQTQGEYDIMKEQNVPDFAAAARHLEWRLKTETYGPGLDTAPIRASAVEKYTEESGYTPHGTQGDYYCLGGDGMIMKSITRGIPVWQTDTSLIKPTGAGQRIMRKYNAFITYDVYEIHDLGYDGVAERWELSDDPIGEVTVSVEYDVTLVARLVTD